MKCSKGGVSLGDILEMDVEEFSEAIEAAAELEKDIAAAMK